MARKQTTAEAPNDRPLPTKQPAEYRAWLKATPIEAKMEELRDRRRAAHERLVEIDSGDLNAQPPSPSDIRVDLRVKVLLGETEPTPISAVTASAECREELIAIDRALEILSQRKGAELNERIVNELMLRSDEWRQLNYEVAQLVLQLRSIHRQREAYLTGLIGPAGRPVIATSAVNLESLFQAGQPLKKFLEAAATAGLIATSEVKI